MLNLNPVQKDEWDHVLFQVWVHVRAQVGGQVWDQVEDQVGGQVWDQIRAQVRD